MDLQALEAVGKAAGIGGIALGVVLLLFRETLRKVVLPKLAREHAFRILTLVLVLVWSVALAGIGAWTWVETRPEGGAVTAGAEQPSGPSATTSGDQSPTVQNVEGSVTINSNSDGN